MSKYVVIDKHTGRQATKTEYKSLSTALRAVDRLDNEYGGYRYQHKKVDKK